MIIHRKEMIIGMNNNNLCNNKQYVSTSAFRSCQEGTTRDWTTTFKKVKLN